MTTPIVQIGGDIDIDIDIDNIDDLNPFTMILPQDIQENDTNHAAPQHQQQQLYFLQSINSNIVIRQLPSQGLSFQLWPAATILVTLLDNNNRNGSTPFSNLFKRQENGVSLPLRILELGSGTGVVGIAAAAILGAKVTVTDLPHVLPNIQFNVDGNSKVLDQQSGVVDVAALSWGESKDMEAVGRDYDLILGSDVVYHDHLYDPLIKTLRFFLLGGGKKIVFVMAHLRRWKKESVFFKRAKKLFDVKIIHAEPPSNGSRIGVVVYLFTGKR
ncbi:uncharacterized protein LOC132046348 [Lycium ferocissimum]|uniref:uncharacterized protein LOC132046348 n=1 Tax=Lycium ferocissimum TaxID=112874 RepID=UPI002814E41A|nr:uncharacterized protein LOC132046348 [Lycium ferocissimum]